MRSTHSFYERLVEPREVYGLPITNLVIVGTIIFIIIRNLVFRLSWPVAQYVAASAAPQSSTKDINSKGRPDGIKNTTDYVARKCQKYIYHFLWFSAIVPWLLCIASRTPYFDCRFDFYSLVKVFSEEGYGMTMATDGTVVETDYSTQPWTNELHAILVVQLAWYMHNFVEDTLWDRQRSDYIMMIAHHLVAMALITICFQANIERGGLYVLILMDCMDYYLYCVKLFTMATCDVYGKPKTRLLQLTQKVLSLTLLVFWWITRVWLFGTVSVALYYAAYMHENIFTKSEHWAGQALPPYVAMGLGLILSLFVLQSIWFILIIKLVAKTLRAGRLVDIIARTYPNDPAEKRKGS